MSREIQPGDYVKISLSGKDESMFIIKTVSKEKIDLSPLDNDTKEEISLVPNGNSWNISGSTIIYEIEFLSGEELQNSFLTGTRDVDIKILTYLNDEKLKLVCQLNKYASDLCNNYMLWDQKIKKFIENRKYGDEDSMLEEYGYYNRRFEGSLKDIYIKLRLYYSDNSTWVVFRHNDNKNTTLVLGVYRRKKDATKLIVEDVWEMSEYMNDIKPKTIRYQGIDFKFDELVEIIYKDGYFSDKYLSEQYDSFGYTYKLYRFNIK